MKVYRIRRKSDGKYFAGWVAAWNKDHAGKSSWEHHGHTYRQLSTIKRHLRMLCSVWYPEYGKKGTPSYYKYTIKIIKKLPTELKKYEIIVNDITRQNADEIVNPTKSLIFPSTTRKKSTTKVKVKCKVVKRK